MSPKEIKYKKNIMNNIFFAKQLDNLGVIKSLTGYYFLIEIMNILINEERDVTSFSREVYPIVAKKFGKTDCTIERNIRNLIAKSWSLELMEKLEVYYPIEQKPSCREFIFLVKNYIYNQIN